MGDKKCVIKIHFYFHWLRRKIKKQTNDVI